ncbi:hypothetical protein BD309DRAFT_1084165 [Dichomitus squalens]|nr:hypothetical protein BD309DRAFT_1084165 [Dichomitus squalens]
MPVAFFALSAMDCFGNMSRVFPNTPELGYIDFDKATQDAHEPAAPKMPPSKTLPAVTQVNNSPFATATPRPSAISNSVNSSTQLPAQSQRSCKTKPVAKTKSLSDEILIEILKDIYPNGLSDVTITLHFLPSNIVQRLGGDSEDIRLCSELDRVLLTFPRSGIVIGSGLPIPPRRTKLWFHEMSKLFPGMKNRRPLNIVSQRAIDICHEASVKCTTQSVE